MKRIFAMCNNIISECSEYQDFEFDSLIDFEQKLSVYRGIIFLYDKNNIKEKDALINKIRRNYEIIEMLDQFTCVFFNQNDEKKYSKYIENQYFFEFQPSILFIEKYNNKYKSTKVDFDYLKFYEKIKIISKMELKQKKSLPNSGVILDEKYQGTYNYNNDSINLDENNIKFSNQNFSSINNENNNSKISQSICYSKNNNYFNNNNNPKNSINNYNGLKEIDCLIYESILPNNNNNDNSKEPEKEKPKFKIDPKKIEEAKKRLPPERNEDDEDITLVIYRFPKSNKRENRIFSKYDKIVSMFDYVISLGDEIFEELNQEEFILTQTFPRKIIDYDQNLTFEETGLIEEVIVNIEPKQ